MQIQQFAGEGSRYVHVPLSDAQLGLDHARTMKVAAARNNETEAAGKGNVEFGLLLAVAVVIAFDTGESLGSEAFDR